MSSTQQLIEVALTVTAPDEATAVTVAEILARTMLALSAENVHVSLDVDRYVPACHHEHDEVEP